jgi:F0F1-type ATP synthase assembly protein I
VQKWVLATRFIGIGWYIGICVAGGIGGGIWLDNKLGTSLIFTLVGLFLGLGVAVLGTYRMIAPLIREQQREDKEDS